MEEGYAFLRFFAKLCVSEVCFAERCSIVTGWTRNLEAREEVDGLEEDDTADERSKEHVEARREGRRRKEGAEEEMSPSNAPARESQRKAAGVIKGCG